VLSVLQEAIGKHGPPDYIRSDNGPEFTAQMIQQWLEDNPIQTNYIDPGCRWQNNWTEMWGPITGVHSQADCV